MKNGKTIPEEDIEHERVCFTCSEDIEKWVRGVTARGQAYRYDFLGWPADLWNRTAKDAIEFIADRFSETKDEREYYCCMLYLTKVIDAATLFVLWKDSPNYREILAEEARQKVEGNTNIAPGKLFQWVPNSVCRDLKSFQVG